MTTKKDLQKLIQIVQEVRKVAPDIPLKHFEALLICCRKDRTPLTDLTRQLYLGNAANVSQIAGLLATYGRGKAGGGLGLLHLVEDDENRRYKNIILSKKGTALKDEILKLLEND
jgi:hypothetical protein